MLLAVVCRHLDEERKEEVRTNFHRGLSIFVRVSRALRFSSVSAAHALSALASRIAPSHHHALRPFTSRCRRGRYRFILPRLHPCETSKGLFSGPKTVSWSPSMSGGMQSNRGACLVQKDGCLGSRVGGRLGLRSATTTRRRKYEVRREMIIVY